MAHTNIGNSFAIKTDTMKTSHHLFFYLIIMAILPLAMSCRKEAATGSAQSYACISDICLTRSGAASCYIGNADFFVYEDNATGYLDSYLHLNNPGERVEIASRSGNKRFVAIANAGDGTFIYNDIVSYEGLGSIYSHLSDEIPETPLMSGEASGRAGRDGLDLVLRPLMARVRINSFFVDFIGKTYSASEFRNPRAYLINVSGMCPMSGEYAAPVEILNQGRLDERGCMSMSRPDLLLCDDVTGHPLFCYPCDGTESAPGYCTTRLVVEGDIDGVTYYYPINVGGGKVERGQSYVYDITITRPGMTDPDIPIEKTMAKVEMHIENWEEYDNETIYY